MRTALADCSGMTDVALIELLSALANAEILRPAGAGLRIAPEILADVMLERASFNERIGIEQDSLTNCGRRFTPSALGRREAINPHRDYQPRGVKCGNSTENRIKV
jgi:hypothetical protein